MSQKSKVPTTNLTGKGDREEGGPASANGTTGYFAIRQVSCAKLSEMHSMAVVNGHVKENHTVVCNIQNP